MAGAPDRLEGLAFCGYLEDPSFGPFGFRPMPVVSRISLYLTAHSMSKDREGSAPLRPATGGVIGEMRGCLSGGPESVCRSVSKPGKSAR